MVILARWRINILNDESGAGALLTIPIGFAQPGLVPFNANNENPTWSGFVTVDSQSVRCVVKGLSTRQLLNECFCAMVAHAAGVPVPRSFLVINDDAGKIYESPIRSEDGKGIYFGSELRGLNSVIVEYRKLTGNGAVRQIVDWIVASGKLGEIYSFDEHCANTDRNSGNLLLSPSSEIWLIDHGRALTGPDWKIDDLDAGKAYESRLEGWCTPELTGREKSHAASDVGPYALKAQAIDFGRVVSYLINLGLLTEEEGDALTRFIRDRIVHLPPLVARALRHPTVAI